MEQQRKQAHRWKALLMAFLLAAPVFVSCSDGAEEPTGEEPVQPVHEAAEPEPEETKTKYAADYLPDVTYDGYEFRIIAYNEYPADVSEPSGEVIDDAIYQRSILIEEKYDIQINQTLYPFTDYSKVSELVTNAGRAQSDDFDLATMVFRDTYNLVLEGLVPTASSLPVIDMTQPWYIQSTNDSITIDGITLFAYTAFDVNPGGVGIIFNKNMVEDLGMENPYELVRSGDWTTDKLYSMAEASISDLDGDGQMTEADCFGFITEWDRATLVAYTGSGNKLVDIEDGVPVMSQKEELFDAFQLAHQYFGKTGFMFDTFKAFGTAEASRVQGYELYKQGHAMFLCTGTDVLVSMGDMESDYGLLPMPKWSAEQDRYYNMGSSETIAVPLSCSTNLELICIIKEALAVEALNLNWPAYYENALKNRYLRDEESLEMLEIITASCFVDLGQNPWWDVIRTPWLNELQKESGNFASAVAQNRKKSEKNISKLMEMIAALKEQ